MKHLSQHPFRLLLYGLLLSLVACFDDDLTEVPFPVAITGDFAPVDIDAFRLSGRIDYQGFTSGPVSGGPELEYGFLISTSNPELSDLNADDIERRIVGSNASGSVDFSILLQGLSLSVDYYFQAYLVATTDDRRREHFGAVKRFTPGNNFQLTMLDEVDVFHNTAQVKGLLTINLFTRLEDHGFLFSTDENALDLSNVTVGLDSISLGETNDSGEFSALLDTLAFNTTYFVKAYAVRNQKPFYSNTIEFSTKGGWRRLISLDNQALSDAVGASLPGVGYVGLGCASGCEFYDQLAPRSRRMWSFDPTIHEYLDSLPKLIIAPDSGPEGRTGAVGFFIGDRLFYGLGRQGSFFLWDCWLLTINGNTGTWEEIDFFPGTLRKDAVGFAQGGLGFIGAGEDEYQDGLDDFWILDPQAPPGEMWQSLDCRLPLYNSARRDSVQEMGRTGAVAFLHEQAAYVGLGTNNAFELNDLWRLNLDIETLSCSWELVGELDLGEREGAVAFTIGTDVYVGGGLFFGSSVFDYYKVNPADWSVQPILPIPDTAPYDCGSESCFDFGFAVNGKGYTGLFNPLLQVVDIWEYTPPIN